jgi:hypothetical protein
MRAHLKYFNYVVRHKWFVFQAGRRTGASLWRLLKHDWSKFLPSEWVPYVWYFYGDREQFAENERWFKATGISVGPWLHEVERSFDLAWLHHQRRNDHHWQFWVLRNDDGTTRALQMTDATRREMLADWMGAGRAITGRWETAEWYAKNREKIMLHPETRAFIEAKLAPDQPKGEN